ncbi:heavy-metal-associated domain-containing protein [Gordonia soli]|uniref:Copper chaperone CopZ n=1 Tax=Gordonia soli NBRC 108243 TaxID=1223545 RepID=M0QHZ2_9ACTN|nr:heavy-metal-associated domain-containing protein [Gordonia soli]GAC67042.1 copper chaperone CopZ [Gordonia soli NBRC 108243]
MSSTAEFTVSGMTCGHCAASVREEIGEIAGVEKVDVDVVTGRVEVISASPVDAGAVAAAVTEAGYSLA